MLEDSININNFRCNPVVLKKKLVKRQQKLLFWTQFALQRGQHEPCPKRKSKFFGRNNKSRSLAFRNVLFYQDIKCFDWVTNLFLFVWYFFIGKESLPAKTAALKYIPFIVKWFLSFQYFEIRFMYGSLVIAITTDDC